MKIAVISDTHNFMGEKAKEKARECDCLLHAGDFCSEKMYNEIKSLVKPDKPFFAVRGNNDLWACKLPESLEFEIGGASFFMTHKRENVPADVKADVIVFGHSHRFFRETKNCSLWLNPGSCGRRRFGLSATMAVIDLGCEISVEKIELEEERAVRLPERNLPAVVRKIMRGMDRGESIETMSRRLGLDLSFVDDVARIKVTHPDANEYDIVNKMEVNRLRTVTAGQTKAQAKGQNGEKS